MKMVRIKYWQQETVESGRWVLTGLISLRAAKKLIDDYEQGKIVTDSEFEWKEKRKTLWKQKQ